MKVVICMAHDEAYDALAAITRPSAQNYCAKHGYIFCYDPNRTDKDACKIALYQQAYMTGYFGTDDLFVWIDTDALVMNSDRRIESVVYEHMPRGVHYLIGCDVNGINSGVFIARFTPEANLFMSIANNLSVVSGWADQVGLTQTALMEPHRSIYREVPGKVMNCNLYQLKGWELGEYGRYVNDYEDGDLILHLAGVEEPTRSNTLREYAARAK